MALPISYNVRNVIVRWKVTLLALAGISLVVGVLIALTAMANGFSKALAATGSADNAIVTQRGSGSELSSGMSRDNASMIMVDSRVKRDAQGRPMASPEMIIVASLPKRGEATEVNVTVRGVTQMAFSVRQNVKITEGRNFTPGLVRAGRREEGRRALPGARGGRQHQAAAQVVAGGRHLHVGRQRIRKRDLGRLRRAGAGLQPGRRLSVTDACGSRIRRRSTRSTRS